MTNKQKRNLTPTPTPWGLIDQSQELLDQGEEPSFWVHIETEGNLIASCYTKEWGENRANAELIVKAVNAHEDLVALTSANASISSEEFLRSCDKETLIALLCCIRRQSKNALAKAKGDA